MTALAPLTATGIGSVPFTDPQETVALVLETLTQIPSWPQMVRLGYLEEMAAQAARGLPGLKVDEANHTVAMDPDLSREEALAQFYEIVLSGDLTPFAFEAQDAQGFFALLAAVASQGSPGSALKGQLSGFQRRTTLFLRHEVGVLSTRSPSLRISEHAVHWTHIRDSPAAPPAMAGNIRFHSSDRVSENRL